MRVCEFYEMKHPHLLVCVNQHKHGESHKKKRAPPSLATNEDAHFFLILQTTGLSCLLRAVPAGERKRHVRPRPCPSSCRTLPDIKYNTKQYDSSIYTDLSRIPTPGEVGRPQEWVDRGARHPRQRRRRHHPDPPLRDPDVRPRYYLILVAMVAVTVMGGVGEVNDGDSERTPGEVRRKTERAKNRSENSTGVTRLQRNKTRRKKMKNKKRRGRENRVRGA